MHYWTLDFYRFFAAFVVSSSHFFISLNPSEILEYTATLGVDLFFVLSGFVLAPQLIRVKEFPSLHIKVFLIRRWMRTVPPYLFALTCAALLFGYGDALNFVKFLTYTQNFIADSSMPNFFPVAWSLSVEEWFYIFTPLLILVLSKIYKNKVNLMIIAFSIIVILSLIRLGLNDGLNWGVEIRRSVLLRLDAIFFGVIAYLLINKIRIRYLILILFTSFVFILSIGVNPAFLSSSIIIQNLFLPISSIFFSSIILLLTLVNLNSQLIKNIGKFLANVSYSMYLFHLFFIYFLGNFTNNIAFSFLIFISSLITFCYFFFVLVEKPVLDGRPKFKKI